MVAEPMSLFAYTASPPATAPGSTSEPYLRMMEAVRSAPDDADACFDEPVEQSDAATITTPQIASNHQDDYQWQHESQGDGSPQEANSAADAIPDSSSTFQRRHYQITAENAVLEQFKEKARSTLVVMATGTGKTIVEARLAKRAEGWGHGVLWLAHREELIEQGCRALSRVGIHPIIEKADKRALPEFTAGLSKTVVASVQSLRGDRLKAWPENSFKLIISDEAHHAVASGWKAVLSHFGEARHVGFTATADRLDGKNCGQVFESLAYEYNLRDAIKDPEGPYLVPLKVTRIETDPPIDLRDIRITAGDFNQGDLDARIQENIGSLVNASKEALGNRPTICFTPDISSAEAMAAAFNDIGVSAHHISCKSTNRKEILKAFREGKFQVLCNAMILTEGTDLPFVSCILLCRPSKSRALVSQMIGRGTRLPDDNPLSAGKQDCLVVDFAYVTDLPLVHPVELYDNSETPDEVVQMARDMVDRGEMQDPLDALEQAQIEYDLQLAERIKIRERQVRSKKFTYDPIAVMDILGIPQKAGDADFFKVKPATPKMINALRKFKVDAPDTMGFAEAKGLLDKLIGRAQHGWASHKQIGLLLRMGVDTTTARGMRFDEASAYISAHKTW